MTNQAFSPKLFIVRCQWCGSGQGISPASVNGRLREVTVPCSGGISPDLVLNAFWSGADGVLVLRCPKGGCHYIDGNVKSDESLETTREMLHLLGVEDRRFMVQETVPGNGDLWDQTIESFNAVMEELGPAAWHG